MKLFLCVSATVNSDKSQPQSADRQMAGTVDFTRDIILLKAALFICSSCFDRSVTDSISDRLHYTTLLVKNKGFLLTFFIIGFII